MTHYRTFAAQLADTEQAMRPIPVLAPITAKVRQPDETLLAMFNQEAPWTPEQYAFVEGRGDVL